MDVVDKIKAVGFTDQHIDIWVYRFGYDFVYDTLIDYLVTNKGKEEDRNERVLQLYHQYIIDIRDKKINELLKK
jgi:hypothetical protein